MVFAYRKTNLNWLNFHPYKFKVCTYELTELMKPSNTNLKFKSIIYTEPYNDYTNKKRLLRLKI